jgi:hypothetical protein
MTDELRTEVEQVKQQERRAHRIVEDINEEEWLKGGVDAGKD